MDNIYEVVFRDSCRQAVIRLSNTHPRGHQIFYTFPRVVFRNRVIINSSVFYSFVSGKYSL